MCVIYVLLFDIDNVLGKGKDRIERANDGTTDDADDDEQTMRSNKKIQSPSNSCLF